MGALVIYKVVIIDDEEFIVEGLSNYIPWKDFDCEVVAVARDGQEGINIINENNPDIIFTDIRMPNVDGLTMISQIRENHPNTQITVITGFRDFEYARQAINLGVARFVLKPTKMDDLTEALNTMIATLKAIELYGNATTNQKEINDGVTWSEVSDVELSDVEGSTSDEDVSEEKSGSFIVNNALKYIEEHYNSKITLNEVAEKTYVSQWHLSRLLNKYKNQSFCDILNNIRINRAKEMLADPSLKIHDVATLVGFTDVTHFSKTFKKINGISPNEYRNTLN